MNLLRAVSLLRLGRHILAGRRQGERPVYAVTVPAPLAGADASARREPMVVTQPAPLPRVVNG